MTNTEAGPETFPANTAAHRIDRSVRSLVGQFMQPVIALEEQHDDLTLSAEASGHVSEISRALRGLELAMDAAAPLLNRNGRRAPGRDLTEEDRALRKALGELKDLAEDQIRDWDTYDDPSYYTQQGRITAGDETHAKVIEVEARLLAGRTRS